MEDVPLQALLRMLRAAEEVLERADLAPVYQQRGGRDRIDLAVAGACH